jgi:hypothetical protein
LGEAPVEDDGSFNVQIPADIPIEVQLLDADGMALESCGWIWVKNNEPRGCIGCHEDPELVPENRLVKAIAKPSVLLTLPPERRRTVDFEHHIMPVIQSKCMLCHGAGGSLPRLDGNPGTGAPSGEAAGSRAYGMLVSRDGGASKSGAGHPAYVVPGKARASSLIWHLLGRNTARPWDRLPKGDALVRRMPPANAPPLSESERRAFIEWIDLGAVWSSHSTGTEPSQGH